MTLVLYQAGLKRYHLCWAFLEPGAVSDAFKVKKIMVEKENIAVLVAARLLTARSALFLTLLWKT